MKSRAPLPDTRPVLFTSSLNATSDLDPGDTRIILSSGYRPELEGKAEPLLGSGVTDDGELVSRIVTFLDQRLPAASPIVRGVIRNQAAFLSGWATSSRLIAAQIDNTFAGTNPKAVRLFHLPAEIARFSQAYFRYRGVPVENQPKARPRLKQVLPQARQIAPYLKALVRQGSLSKAPAAAPGRYLFATLQPNSTSALLPIAMEMRRRGEKVSFLTAATDETSRQLIVQAGFELRTARVPSLHEAPFALKRFRKHYEQVLGYPSLLELVSQLGLPVWCDLEGMTRALSSRLVRQVWMAHGTAQGLETELRDSEAQTVVYVTGRAIFDELLAGSRSERKKVLYLQGVVPDIPPVFTSLNVDLALVGSLLDCRYLDRCGIPRARQVTVGYPGCEPLSLEERAQSIVLLNQKFPQARQRPIILFASQYATSAFPDWARELNLEVIARTARRMPECYFVIRPHPRLERIDQKFASSLPENAIVSSALSAEEVIAGASVVTTYWSTTALEAVVRGTPLVQVNATGLADYFDISSELGQSTARDAESLHAMLTEAVRGAGDFPSRRSKFLSKNAIPLDDRSAERAADALLTLFAP